MNVAGQLYIQKMLMPTERRDEEVRYEVQAENEDTPTDDVDEQDTVAPMDDKSPIDVVVMPEVPVVDNIPEQPEQTSTEVDSETADEETEPATEYAEEVVETPHEPPTPSNRRKAGTSPVSECALVKISILRRRSIGNLDILN